MDAETPAPDPTPAPLGEKRPVGRPRKYYPLTEERKQAYLEALRATGSKHAAALAVSKHLGPPDASNPNRGSEAFRALEKRDPAFAAAVLEAVNEAVGALEAEVQRRAFLPDERPVIDKTGRIVGVDRNWRSANSLALAILARHKPEWIQKRQQDSNVTIQHSEEYSAEPTIKLTAADLRALPDDKCAQLWALLDEIQANRALEATESPAPAALPAPVVEPVSTE